MRGEEGVECKMIWLIDTLRMNEMTGYFLSMS